MNAVICTRYGPPDVLQLADVPSPTPRKRQLLVRVHATAVTASDCIMRGFRPGFWPPARVLAGLAIGFSRPRFPILGGVFAGEVVGTGRKVKRFAEGDQIFGWTSFPRLGADAVIDYTAEDFTKGSARYDLVLNAVGRKKARLECEGVLTPNGKHITVDDGLPRPRAQDMLFIKELFETGRFRAVIDRTYPLERIVEAHTYADQGHKKGNVVIET
ncbi:MAG TPA: zinc-binding dehydrogenase [Gemmatimonadaceae bacterium]|nr:zinc-binding dehydrogenase [Gemmatimonadaceae bacterium]